MKANLQQDTWVFDHFTTLPAVIRLDYRAAVGWTTFPSGAMRTSPAPYIPPLCAHAAGILLRTSCPNSRGKVRPQEWQSFCTANFVDISHPRSSQQPRTGFKDRPVIINNTFGIFFHTTCEEWTLSLFGFLRRGTERKKCAPPRSLAVLRALSWFCRYFGGSSVLLQQPWGLAPRPACVLGICWTAVG